MGSCSNDAFNVAVDLHCNGRFELVLGNMDVNCDTVFCWSSVSTLHRQNFHSNFAILYLSTAGIKISATAYLGEFFDRNQRPRYFALLSTITTMANIIQPLLGMAILTLSFESHWFTGFVYRPWRLFVLVGSFMTGLTGLIMFYLPEGPAYSMFVGKQRDALNTLQIMYHVNTGRPKKVIYSTYTKRVPSCLVCI